MFFKRFFAVEKKLGSKAKGGQAKTAIKSGKTTNIDASALNLFKPKELNKPLQDLRNIKTQNMDMNSTPKYVWFVNIDRVE